MVKGGGQEVAVCLKFATKKKEARTWFVLIRKEKFGQGVIDGAVGRSSGDLKPVWKQTQRITSMQAMLWQMTILHLARILYITNKNQIDFRLEEQGT